MAFGLKDIVVGIKMALDRGSAEKLRDDMRRTLGTASDPDEAVRNLDKVDKKIMSLDGAIQKLGLRFVAVFAARAMFSFMQRSVQMMGDFEQKIQQSISIMEDFEETMRGKMRDTALQVSKELNIQADKVAEGYYHLASAGYDAESAIKALPIAATFAKAGILDMADAVTFLADAQSSIGYKTTDPEDNIAGMIRIADALTKGNAQADATVSELAEALTNKAGPALRMFKKDVEEGVAALMVLADQGTKGSVAGERYATFLRIIGNAALKNKEAFKAYGIQVFDVNGQMRSTADIVADFEKALGGMSAEAQTAAIGQLGIQVRLKDSIVQFIGMSEKLRNYENDLRSATGYTKDVAEKQMENFNDGWGKIGRSIEAARISMGEGLSQTLKALGGLIGDEGSKLSVVGMLITMAEWFKKNDRVIRDLMVTLYYLVAYPLKILLDALGVVWDFTVGLAYGALAVLGVAFQVLGATVYLATQTLGWFLDLIGMDTEAAKVKKFADQIRLLTDEVDKFVKSTGKQSGKSFVAGAQSLFGRNWFTDVNRPTKPSILDSAFDNHGTVPDQQGGTDDDLGIGEGDKEAKKAAQLAERQARLRAQMEQMIAAISKTPVDDALKRIDELERRMGEVFKDGIPNDIKEGLAKLRAAANQEIGLDKLKDRLDIIKNDKKNVTSESLDSIEQLIDEITTERDKLDQSTKAWDHYNDALNDAIKTRDEMYRESDREFKEYRKNQEAAEEYFNRFADVAENVAGGIQRAFTHAFDVLFVGSKRIGNAMTALFRGIGAAAADAVATYAGKKAKENMIEAAEQLARGIGALGNPFTAGTAALHFKSAAQHTAVAAMWGALAGGASSGASALDGAAGFASGSSDRSGGKDGFTNRGPDIHIHLDGVDPNNPRHQELIGETAQQYQERYGGQVLINGKR